MRTGIHVMNDTSTMRRKTNLLKQLILLPIDQTVVTICRLYYGTPMTSLWFLNLSKQLQDWCLEKENEMNNEIRQFVHLTEL